MSRYLLDIRPWHFNSTSPMAEALLFLRHADKVPPLHSEKKRNIFPSTRFCCILDTL